MFSNALATSSHYPGSIVRRSSGSNEKGGAYFGLKYASSNGYGAEAIFLISTDTTGLQAASSAKFLQILSLTTKRLLAPLSVLVEQDGDGYIAQTIDLPLYGFAETAQEAIEMLKSEIESLYNDLIEDDNFSEEWLTRKKLLSAVVAN